MGTEPTDSTINDAVDSIRNNARILIIDDENTSRMVLAKYFAGQGCLVTTAESGQDGIVNAGETRFDLILLDVNMPEMSGTEALPQILDACPGVRVIIMTAQASYESKVETREMGAYDYIVKPITIERLKEIAEKAIPERRGDQEGGSSGYDTIQLDASSVDQEIAHMVPERMARAFCLVPISRAGNTLIVAMADPYDIVAMDTLKTQTKCEIHPVQANRADITNVIEEIYVEQIDVDQSLHDLVSIQEAESVEEYKTEPELKIEADDAPVIQLVNLILHSAVQSGASDIHIEPGEKTVKVRLRIDGVMQKIQPPPKSLFQAIVSRIKILGAMDIAERRLPQDGKARVRFRSKEVDLRINTLPTVYGESVVIRLLDKDSLFTDITGLGLDDFHQKVFLDAISQPHGMVYLTGPTGSGKTTTLYSGLQHLNSDERKIITVEEPVEYEIPGINQVHVRPDIGLTFAHTLRAILRQDPDVIMVGETRDLETAEIAVRAALTGHLVFSTLHTNDAPSSVTRLLDLGIKPYLISSSLNLIVAQRLIRRLCTECRGAAVPSEQVKEQFSKNGYKSCPDTVYEHKGCIECNQTGYSGRVAIHEFLPVTHRVRQIISDNADETRLRQEAIEMGCTSLMQSGLQKVEQGLTTLDEILRTTLHD